jgi:hypothetical protein
MSKKTDTMPSPGKVDPTHQNPSEANGFSYTVKRRADDPKLLALLKRAKITSRPPIYPLGKLEINESLVVYVDEIIESYSEQYDTPLLLCRDVETNKCLSVPCHASIMNGIASEDKDEDTGFVLNEPGKVHIFTKTGYTASKKYQDSNGIAKQIPIYETAVVD